MLIQGNIILACGGSPLPTSHSLVFLFRAIDIISKHLGEPTLEIFLNGSLEYLGCVQLCCGFHLPP